MKVIVINKNESVICGGKIFRENDTFEVDDVVAKSLIERGYVKEVTNTDTEDEAELKTGYLDKNELEEMSYSELRRLAAQMGLDATGKKTDLIERISGEEVTVGDETEAEDEAEEADGDLPNTAMPD